MIQKFNTDRIRDIIMILKDRDSMIKSDIKKALDAGGGRWTFKTVLDYLNHIESRKIISFNKTGRVCNVCLTEKGKKLVQPMQATTAALK